PATARWAHAIVRDEGQDTIEADVFLLADDGAVVMEARGLCVQRLESSRRPAGEAEQDRWLYEVQWRSSARQGKPAERGSWLIFSDGRGVGARLQRVLEERGQRVALVRRADGSAPGPAGMYEIDPTCPADFDRLLASTPETQATALRGVVHL